MAALTDQILSFDNPERILQSREVRERGIKNSVLQQKQVERIARRQYSSAMKSGDYSGAWQALSELEKRGQSIAGIEVAGRKEAVMRKRASEADQIVSSINGGRTVNPDARPLTDSARTANPNSRPLGSRNNPAQTGQGGFQQDQRTPLGQPLSNLSSRLGLFDRMKTSAIDGTGMDQYRAEASSLGIDDAGFNLGSRRAAAAVGPSDTPSGGELQNRLRTFSPEGPESPLGTPQSTIPPIPQVDPNRLLTRSLYA